MSTSDSGFVELERPGQDRWLEPAWTVSHTITRETGLLQINRGQFEDFYRNRWAYTYQEPGVGDVRGFAIVTPPGHINAIGTAPEWEGRGVGSALLEEVVDGHSHITLYVRADNSRARQFYEGRGFEVAAEDTDYYSDGTTGYFMRHTGSKTMLGKVLDSMRVY